MKEKQTNYEQILSVAEELIQSKGYNAFSYRDIAQMVGIKTASIHYYFPTKADLGEAVVKKHLDNLTGCLCPILDNENLSSTKKLTLFLDGIVAKTYTDNHKMCLGGMLASDVLTLSEGIQKQVQYFFIRIMTWIKRLLTEGIEKKEILLEKEDVESEAMLILSLFEGALLLARCFQDEAYLLNAKDQILNRLMKQ